jgi:N-methylhydantoinase A
MSKILRIVSIERGFDPRRFALVAFGGAGPMHACALAEELHISRIIVPPSPGMFSALGLLTADLFHDSKRAIMKRTDALDPSDVEKRYQEMEAEGRRTLSAEGVDLRDMRFVRQLDMRYYRQSFELTVGAAEPFDENALRSACSAFHDRHRYVYGYSVEDEPIEVVNVLLRAVGLIPRPRPKQLAPSSAKTVPRERRRAYFETISSWEETPVFDRETMGSEDTFAGPVIVEQYDATTVVYPGWGASVDVYGDMILRRRGA